MIVEPYYRGFRIHIDAVAGGDDRWDARVNIRRVLSEEKPTVEVVTCKKMTPEIAETAAVIWAKRWVDLNRAP